MEFGPTLGWRESSYDNVFILMLFLCAAYGVLSLAVCLAMRWKAARGRPIPLGAPPLGTARVVAALALSLTGNQILGDLWDLSQYGTFYLPYDSCLLDGIPVWLGLTFWAIFLALAMIAVAPVVVWRRSWPSMAPCAAFEPPDPRPLRLSL